MRVGAIGKAAAIVRDPFGVQPNDSDYLILSLLYDTVTIPAKSPLVAPRLATRWEAGEDLRTWRFTLAENVAFHDGSPCTAEDVAWSVRRLRQSEAGTSRLPGIDVSGIRAEGPRTLVIESRYPNSRIPLLLRLTTFVQKKGTTDPAGAPGTGPFELDWFRDGNARLVRNDNWFGGEVHLDAIEVRMFDRTASMVNAVLTGEIDLASNAGAVAARTAGKRDGVQVVRRPDDTAHYVVMRTSDGPFADPRVREAVKLAVDRKALVDQAISGYGKPANDILGTGDPCYAKDIPQRERNIDRARKLLDEAGFDRSRSYQLLTTEEIPGMAESATLLANQLQEAGVKIDVRKQDQATFLGASRGKAPLYTSFYGTQDSVVFCAGKLLVSESKLNEAAWHDPAFDAAYQQVVSTADDKRGAQLSHDLQQVQHERSGLLVWGAADGIDLASDKVGGLPDLPGYGRVQLERAWLSG
ncbi:ABC transporter substrate-binding protein [Amycolatopsis minnesotensis]|uniref:ABC transporter substrate-binding protein n=1 Tax=Amycolatopsis minnesotensis TaxID=337894 RepID=A0ABP5C668_9PSEU